jgi:hypothetical protein
MPYPNQHSLRLQDPGKFDEFRTTAGGKLYNKIEVPKTVNVIWGHLKGADKGTFVPQALRFNTKSWTADEAKKWIKDNEVKGTFEPAKEEENFSHLFDHYKELKALSEQMFQSLRDRLYKAVQAKLKDYYLTDWSENMLLLRKDEFKVNDAGVKSYVDQTDIFYQLKYGIDANGEIIFDGEPIKVRQVITYVPIVEPVAGG